MNSRILDCYDHLDHFLPLLPVQSLARLQEASRPVVEASLKLQGALAPATRAELQELVRAMNSYYSNRIEGQSTHPLNIERALRSDFSLTPDIARRQRIARAHIEAEQALEGLGLGEPRAFHSDTLKRAHFELYSRLGSADRLNDQDVEVLPGEWRDRGVAIHRHEPPPAEALAAFLARADGFYVKDWGLDGLLAAAASAHHRLIWVHPFLDGNGRASRLQLHLILQRLTAGLWSVNRGLARDREGYYLHLAEADMHRQGALDGRGNLSEKTLTRWCEFFIAICLDQVRFMTELLAPETLSARLAAWVKICQEEFRGSGYREEAILPLQHIALSGPVSRADFTQMTGLGPSSARKIISRLLSDGLLKSDSHKGLLRIGFPLGALHILFPRLYPEAAGIVNE